MHEEIYAIFRPPKELLSDNRTNFLSSTVRHFLNLLKTNYRLTTPYYLRTNGKVENLNGTLRTLLTKICLNKNVRL